MAGEEVIEEPPEDAPPSRGARLRKWALRVSLALAAIIGIGLFTLDTPIGHRFVADRIAALSPQSGLKIRIGRIEGSLYGEATLHDLVLSDPKGPFLTVPEVELDWRPFRWFTSGLDIRNLVLHRGTLLRAPELEPGDPEAPILPDFDIRIDRFEIDRLKVAEGMLGEERIVNFLARANIRDGRVLLEANGELGGEDRLAAMVDAEPDDDRFDLNLDYFAPQGGLLAGLVGARDDLRLRLVGEGAWSKWRGAFVATQDGERLAALRVTADEGIFGLLGQVRPNGYVGGLAAAALGDTVRISARGTLVDSVLDGSIALFGAGIRGTGAGAIDLADNALDAFKVGAWLIDEGIAGEGVTIEGGRLAATLDGPFRDLAIEHVLDIATLDVDGTVFAGLHQEGTATYDGTRWKVPLGLDVARVEFGDSTIDPLLVGGHASGELVLAGNTLLSDDLTLAFPGLGARLNLRGDMARGGFALAGPVAARGLPIADFGFIDGNAKIVFTIGDGVPWRLNANFAGQMPRITNGTLASISGGDIRFTGGVALGGGEPIRFRETQFTSNKLSLALAGSVEGGVASLAGSGRHEDYGPFTMEARIADDGPHAELVFADPLPAAGLKDVRVALAPIADGFRIETEGGSRLGPFDGVIDLYQQAGGPTLLAVRRLDVWRTSVTGNVTLGEDAASGTLALAGGGLDGTIRLLPRGGGQGFDVDIAADNARFGGATPISIGAADIDLAGTLAGGETTIEGTVRGQGISYGNLFVGRLSADARLVNGAGDFTATLAGRRGSQFELQLQGDIAPERIALVARGSHGERQIAMPRRAVLTKTDDGGWRLAETEVSYGSGVLLAQGRYGGAEPLQGTLKLANMPLSLIDAAGYELGLGGRISGIVDLGASSDGLPTGEARVMVDDLSRSGLVLSSKPIDLALVARLSPDLLQMRAALEEDGERRGRMQMRVANLPADVSLYDRIATGEMLGQLRYKGPAAALWRLIALESFDLTGTLSAAANARGSLRDPIVRGSLAGDDLRMQSALTGTDVHDIRARGRFDGPRLELTSFAGNAANGGRISGSGIVDLANIGGGRGPRIDIRIAARDALLLDRSDMAASVTGPLRIVSSGIGGTIAGRLEVVEGRWQLGRAEAVELPNIATREINQPADVRPVRTPAAPWRYLIDARTTGGLDVRGMGLESEWSADIVLRGTTADPRIGGVARVVRRQGSYSFAGTRFEITRGVIDFDETVPPDPRISLIAETEVNGLNLAVSVSGSSSQPEVAFSSVPALPEEEVLSRLLFGGSITEISPTDALQLGAALASLRGGGGVDPINRLRSAIGLDRLRIVPADPALDRGTSIALGKNIGRRFYAEIITDGQSYSATRLEFRVTGWLSLLASVSTIGRESIAAEFSRDY